MRSQLVLEGRFRVFEDGTVNRIKDGVEKTAKVTVLKSRGHGYPLVSYYENGKQKQIYVSRLIASAFVPNPHNYKCVLHKDGDSENNCASNLEWGSAINKARSKKCKVCGRATYLKDSICPSCKRKPISEELQRRLKARRSTRYENIDLSVCSEKEKEYVKLARQGVSIPKIADNYKVSNQCVSAALRNAEEKTIIKQMDEHN